MTTIHRSRTAILAVAAVLAIGLSAPIAVQAEEQVPALAPVAGPSWDEASGYGSVEASRAAASALLAPGAAPSWDETSGYGAVEASRAATAEYAAAVMTSQGSSGVRWAPEWTLDRAMTPAIAAAMAWDASSGYGAVEAIRAAR